MAVRVRAKNKRLPRHHMEHAIITTRHHYHMEHNASSRRFRAQMTSKRREVGMQRTRVASTTEQISFAYMYRTHHSSNHFGMPPTPHMLPPAAVGPHSARGVSALWSTAAASRPAPAVAAPPPSHKARVARLAGRGDRHSAALFEPFSSCSQ